MTATFGKLEHKTLTLQPGLNVIQAPNEWGKSTWCAFLTAMLYGLDTRAHSTKTTLSDKERYAPWSGAPMSGRMDLQWNGRDITIERRTKGRTVFGDFRAYETASGLPIPELTAQNCGQQLLGVEKTVFTRSAMIRLTDLPVTQDEALRRRLNALVTTGDDSGAAEHLERRLRELKNRCRYNRTGLLPQAEAEAAALDAKLRSLDELESQSRTLRQRCSEVEATISSLENHQKALAYSAAQENAKRQRSAEIDAQRAAQALRNREAECAALPDHILAVQTLAELHAVQHQWVQLRMDADTPALSPHPIFGTMAPEDARIKTDSDIAAYRNLQKWHLWALILGLLILAAGISVALLTPEYRIYGYIAIVIGALAVLTWIVYIVLHQVRAGKIAASYGSKDPASWIVTTKNYVNQHHSIRQSEVERQETIAALRRQTEQLCQGRSLADALSYWQEICARWDALDTARAEYRRSLENLAVLRNLPTDVPAPEQPDRMTLTSEQTRQALADAARTLRELQHRLGQCQGQMEAIGHRTDLEARQNALQRRIQQLEDTYAALALALSTLENARAALQRRFAPRITSQAQEILNRLTDGRYDRLVLGPDLTLQVTATDEDALRSTLWRSDGTADLLYLSLRLAVAGELTPQAPLILDDALVRFDDQRLKKALEVLKEEADQRQILLFTCHTRESQYV